ncbi:MAG: hypothetical protein JWO72_537 [Caulobacteraceae bacterium]|nr:hypothetical protein [Caulobacteraceae bacterium]
MNIIAKYDSSVTNAPAGYTTAIQSAINYLDNLITNNITITIAFGWGEVNGQAVAANAAGENQANGYYYSYAQVKNALLGAASSPDDRASVATLPGADPTNGGRFFVTMAQAQALGLGGASTSTVGWVGLNASDPYTFDPANRAVVGTYDAVGVLEHEITEILGRSGSMGSAFGSNIFTALDLFRFSSAGVRQLTPGTQAYFSVDGSSMLLPYNDPTNGGDATDWALSVKGDSFGAAYSGRSSLVSATDLRVMDVLGYTLAGAPVALALTSTSPADHALSVPLSAPIVLNFNKTVSLATGSFQIHRATDGSILEAISASDTSQVSHSGATITLTPALALPAGGSYYVTLDGGTVVDSSGAAFGGITASDVLAFTVTTASQAVDQWLTNVLRAGGSGGLYAGLQSQLTGQINAGTISPDAAVHQVVQAASATTSVATLAYEFFTGATPTAGGLDYLVSPTGPNPNNLNSAYYQSFSDTNRYINFAVNLGKLGAGAANFAAQYANLSLSAATSQEYAAIFGSVPTAAKVDALLNTLVVSSGLSMTRAEYLAGYGQDGLNGLGTKAAVAGWLMAEAVHADVGIYATANDSYLTDVATGHASFNVDLVGQYHGMAYVGA